jgi:hypothetical protein
MNYSDSHDPLCIVVGDSAKTNSLGRALSMALTAAVFADVRIVAYADGALWSGAAQFDLSVETFGRADIDGLATAIIERARERTVYVWFSKGTHPLPLLAVALQGAPQVVLIADFDDDDLSIMRTFAQSSFVNRLKANRLRRKAPGRLKRSQERIAALSDTITFSSTALGEMYAARWNRRIDGVIVPHTRLDIRNHGSPKERTNLTLGFVGTLRSYKGADIIVSLLRADTSVTLVTFQQDWSPPADVVQQVTSLPSSTPLSDMYSLIDWLILPMDAETQAAALQLPAKLVDAAVNSCAVAATPTAPIREMAGEAFLPIIDWADSMAVLIELRQADKERYGKALREMYEQRLSPQATATSLVTRLGRNPVRAPTNDL